MGSAGGGDDAMGELAVVVIPWKRSRHGSSGASAV